MGFNISDLKRALGTGLGLRKNKYLIEIPIQGMDGRTLNILCRSAGLPERNIQTVTAVHKGRKYNMRAETDFGGSYEITVLDDSNMRIRKTFDKWFKKIDNTKPRNLGLGGASFEADFLEELVSGVDVANAINTGLNFDGGESFFLGFLDEGNANSQAPYQADINIWQLGNKNEKVYGYKLQNAFPSSMGVVDFNDSENDTLSEFSITFTFSEFIPLENKSFTTRVGDALIGDDIGEIRDGIEDLFN